MKINVIVEVSHGVVCKSVLCMHEINIGACMYKHNVMCSFGGMRYVGIEGP